MHSRSIILANVFAFLALCGVTCAGCLTAAQGTALMLSAGRPLPERGDRVVLVAAQCGPTPHGGSGVIVGPALVLTAAHVVPCADPVVTVTTIDHREIRMQLRLRVMPDDVAQLVPINGAPFGDGMVPAVATPRLGDRVCAFVANPERTVSCGKISKLTDDPDGIEHGAVTIPGNSGSPVYDTLGRLVGIITRMRGTVDRPLGGRATPLASRIYLVQP